MLLFYERRFSKHKLREHKLISLINFINAPCFIGEMELIGAQNTSNEFTAITECTCYAIAVIFHRNCGKYEEKRPMIFSVPLDTAKQKQDKRIEGTLSDMLEEAMAFCVRNMKNRTIIDLSTGKHVNKTEYPRGAIREAILNALIHRDYSHHIEGTPIQINFFTDRLEIHMASPPATFLCGIINIIVTFRRLYL